MRTDEIVVKVVGLWRDEYDINIIPKDEKRSVEKILRNLVGKIISKHCDWTLVNKLILDWQQSELGIKTLVIYKNDDEKKSYLVSHTKVSDNKIFLKYIGVFVRGSIRRIGENIELNSLSKSEQAVIRKKQNG